MIKNKFFVVGIFVLILGTLLLGGIEAYSVSTPSYSLYNNAGGVGGSFASFTQQGFDSELCSAGTDFLLQIQPFECEPAVVRSDLLEEQDVTVLCKIGATQINPLIDVQAINTLNIVGEYPREIKSIGYFPSQSALGYYDFDETLTDPALNNLGYVAITLRQNPNESSMPDFVSGNLTAKINYDVKNAFGVGQAEFYLPVLNDEDYFNNINQYSFWEGRGYLRADSVGTDDASISLYSDVSSGSASFGNSGKQRVTQVRLNGGETSGSIYIPGFSPCLASMKLKLNGVEDPDTRAELLINTDHVEINDNGDFLESKCTVTDLDKNGLNQKVSIRCKEDDGSSSFNLFLSPRVRISIDGIAKDYSVGDYLYSNNGRGVYLGYISSKGGSTDVENLYAVLVSLPEEKTKLTEDEISSIAIQMNLLFSDTEGSGAAVFDIGAEILKKFSGASVTLAKWTVSGQNIQKVDFKTNVVSPQYDFEGEKVSLSGFSEGEDNGVVEVVPESYDLQKANLDVGGILPKQVYKVYKDGEDTGYYFTASESGSPKFILRKNTVTEILGVGEFYGKDCSLHQSCSEYILSKVDNSVSGDFFEGVVSGSVLVNENKLVLNKLVFNSNSNELYKQYYDKAITDFETVLNSFGGLSIDGADDTYGERALYQAINLSKRINQNKALKQLCQEFIESYPDSIKPLDMCEDDYSLSNSGISNRDVLVNGEIKTISFEGIKEPTYQEYGAEVLIRSSDGKIQTYQLRKDKVVYLNLKDNASGSEYIKLDSVDEDSARVTVYVSGENLANQLFSLNSYTFDIDETRGIGGGYSLTLTDTNIEKVARVSVVPSFNYQNSESEFGFNIGIEKRSIQLSDEQIENRVDSLSNAISDLEKASNALNTFNEASAKVCLATGAVLTAKNFLANSDGKSIARQKVMRSSGGWNDFCASEVSKGNYISLDDCFLENSDEIDSQVDEVFNTIQTQNERIKQLEADSLQTGTLTNKVVDQQEFMKDYSQIGSDSLVGLGNTFVDPTGKNEPLEIDEIKNLLSYQGWESGIYSIDDLKDIELYATLVKSTNDAESKKSYSQTLYSLLYDVQNNAGNFVERTSFFDKYSLEGHQGGFISSDDKIKRIQVSDLKTWADVESSYPGGMSVVLLPNSIIFPGNPADYLIADNELVYPVVDIATNREYLLVLNDDYIVTRTFQLNPLNGQLVMVNDKVNPLSLAFDKYDEGSYENSYKNPEVRYYEEDPYKGYPAIVPLDTNDGWYAATKPKLPVGSQITAYDASGRLNSFWLCNVGSNGLEEFSSSGLGDDICQQINVGVPGTVYNQFAGLSESKTTRLVTDAVDSIEKAQRAYKNGVNSVRINGQNYKVGEPAVETPAVQCQDFMSPKECNLLFNVCDPVVCPSSRCDFGGAYPVKDVVQTGIVGSIALCAPNYKEGIKVPVCTTGVQAGLDSWISVQESYRDCLQENLESGETIGVCDEIHSVYACEFFWRQSIPLAKVAVPKLIGLISGENTRGGGEYLGLQSAWDNAKDSLDYFKQYYASESYNAFKVRSVDEAGTAVCKSYVSTVYPSSAELLDSLTTPRSPPQFTGSFDEIPFTTATNPPTSQYKVYYHIYSGQDSGAYYRVYLKGGSGSFYQDSALNRVVDSGYVSVGDYASDTVDFTAPSGYTQLCIVVNNQEECGFGKVSTSFAVNYVNDLYLQEQTTSGVTTEEECVSGSASLYSLLNPNLQDVAEGLINPELYQKGITRVCATNSPGIGTDAKDGTENARWRKVGYCTDTNVGCWLDTDSVKDAIKSLDVENSVLNDTAQSYLDDLVNSGDYVNNQNYSQTLRDVKKESDSSKKIEIINNILDKVFFSNQKAELYFLRGLAYGDLSGLEFGKIEQIKTNSVDLGTIVDDQGNVCILPQVPSDISSIDDARQRVLKAAEKLDGGLAFSGDYACYSAAVYVYQYAGVSAVPSYADKSGATYTLKDSNSKVTIGVDKTSQGSVIFQVGTGYNKIGEDNYDTKLASLQPGDQLDIVWASKLPHSVIFISWINPATNEETTSVTGYARIFDWNGADLKIDEKDENGLVCGEDNKYVRTLNKGKVNEEQYCNTYRYTNLYLTSDVHPVYLYRSPQLSGTTISTGTGGTGVSSVLAKFSSGYSSPDIEFQDGTSYRNVHYKFQEGGWYWFNPKDNFWYSVSDSIEGKAVSLEVNRQIITSLQERNGNYIEGLGVIINNVLSFSGGVLFGRINFISSSPDLKTENVNLNSEGIFKVDLSFNEQPYYFRFKEGVWEFNPTRGIDPRYWFDVSDVSFNKAASQVLVSGEAKVVGSIPSDPIQSVTVSLVDKTYFEGAALLYDLSDNSIIESTQDVDSQKLDSWESENLGSTDLGRFTSKQISILYDAPSCVYCESYPDDCDSNLCAVIGKKLGASCQYYAKGADISDTPIYNCRAGEGYTDRELRSIYEATQCNDCGSGLGNFCGETECLDIGERIGKTCEYGFLSCKEAQPAQDDTSDIPNWNTLSAEQRDVYSSATQCSDCITSISSTSGTSNYCDANLCASIGYKLGKNCVQEPGLTKTCIEGIGLDNLDQQLVDALYRGLDDNNRAEIMSLIEQGADINVKDDDGWTPLIYASRLGHLDLVKYLVENGADVSVKDGIEGWTALIHASIKGDVDIVKYLVENGAEVNTQSDSGETALDRAVQLNNVDVVSYLQSKGAKSGSEL